ncbi:uncharacterized protein LOC131941925 [Physella acuta]|uniref:uncharacterized protein LOC131941925 n=1 Tax=Physella acuta TaxID=109671 RepID=UPI0027DE2787|nr:uncharacterized protein LOC131941925 [Physella acuta]
MEDSISSFPINNNKTKDLDLGNVDYITFVSLTHSCKLKEAQLQATNQEISAVEKEVNVLRLEKQWCFDEKGNRIIPTAEQQALDISQKLVSHPHLVEDVVKALRMKRIDLQSNLTELQMKLNLLKGDIKKL